MRGMTPGVATLLYQRPLRHFLETNTMANTHTLHEDEEFDAFDLDLWNADFGSCIQCDRKFEHNDWVWDGKCISCSTGEPA